MVAVKCPKCGAEIKYIAMGAYASSVAVAIVDPGYTVVINDNGREIKGHLRHKCPEKKSENTRAKEDRNNASETL